jgi:hypothetical protein
MLLRWATGLAIGCTVFSSPAHALSWSEMKPKLETKLHLLPTHYFEDVGQGTSLTSTVIKLESEFSLRPSKAWRLRVSPWVYSDPVSPSPNEKLIVDANEASLEFKDRDLSVKGGLNSIAWGVTDIFNPLDVVSARRYMDPLNSDKRGVPSLDINWDNGTYHFELIYIPIQLESIMPGEKSRWLPRDITYSRQISGRTLILDQTFNYLYEEREELDDALKNNVGLRLERRGSGFDVTGIFFQGAPTAPYMSIAGVYGNGTSIREGQEGLLVQEITLKPIYYVRRTFGMGAVATFDTTIVRFAASNSDRISAKSVLPGWSQNAIVGVEQNLPVGESTLTLLLQATWAQHEEQADNTITSIDRIFDRSWLFGLRLPWGDWTYTAAFLYDAAYFGKFGQLKIDRKVSDGMTATLQGDVFDGPAGSPVGTYRRNDRVTLGATFFF